MVALGVGQKLGASFVIMICLLVLQGYVSIVMMRTLSSTFDRSVKKASESAALINGIRMGAAELKDFSKMTQFAYAINVKLDQKAASDCLMCHTLPDSDTAKREFATIAGGVHSKLQALDATGVSTEEKQALDRVDRSTAKWSAVFDEFVAKASARRFVDAHSITIERMEPVLESIMKETKELEAVEAGSLVQLQTETAATIRQKIGLLFGLQIAIILPLIFFGWRFIRRLATVLRALAEAAHHLALGNADGALRRLTAAGL